MAFINSLESLGGDPSGSPAGDPEEGISALETLASAARKLPGELFGSNAAGKLELFLREGIAKTKESSPALEAALRFLVLLVKKNGFPRIDLVIDESKKILDRKNGVVHVLAEYAFPPDEAFKSNVKEAIKKVTRASRVDLEGQVNKELIGGYMLRIEDKIMDASIRSRLLELETCLAAGKAAAGSIDGGNQ